MSSTMLEEYLRQTRTQQPGRVNLIALLWDLLASVKLKMWIEGSSYQQVLEHDSEARVAWDLNAFNRGCIEYHYRKWIFVSNSLSRDFRT
jgi:hypothetical protein